MKGLTLDECFRRFVINDWLSLFESQKPESENQQWRKNKCSIIKVVSILYLFLENPLGPDPGFSDIRAAAAWRTTVHNESIRVSQKAMAAFECKNNTVKAFENKLNAGKGGFVEISERLPVGPNPIDEFMRQKQMKTREALISSLN